MFVWPIWNSRSSRWVGRPSGGVVLWRVKIVKRRESHARIGGGGGENVGEGLAVCSQEARGWQAMSSGSCCARQSGFALVCVRAYMMLVLDARCYHNGAAFAKKVER